MQELKSGLLLNRRNFLRNTGLTGIGLAGAAALGLQSTAAHAASATKVDGINLSANDIAVLQFALNLEYVEAEFYSYAATGKSIADNGVDVDGAVGAGGPTTGGVKVTFDTLDGKGPLKDVTMQLMRDEINHVLLIRSILGPNFTIAKPAINLGLLGSYNNIGTYLTLARDFEVIGVSAYGGAVTLLSKPVLQYAAQIALVEGLHSGNLQLLVHLNNVMISPLDQYDIIPPPAGVNYFDDSLNQGLAVIRTPSEVLALAYQNSTPGTSRGGFFPNGVNGAITAV
jgi:hypothetical protein